MEMMAYGHSSANATPSIFAALLHRNKKHRALARLRGFALPLVTEQRRVPWLVRALWSSQVPRFLPQNRVWISIMCRRGR